MGTSRNKSKRLLGNRNKQAVQVLNKIDLDYFGLGETEIPGNPVGMSEDPNNHLSANFGTKREPRRGGCYKGDGSSYINIPGLLTTDTIGFSEGCENSDIPTITSDNRLDIQSGDSIFGIKIYRSGILWGKYNCSENSGSVAYDSSGNGNHGTIVNAVTVTPEENPNSFHQYQDIYSFENEEGYSESGSVLIPKKFKSNLDVLNNPLQYQGKVPGLVKFVKSPCFAYNGYGYVDCGVDSPDLINSNISYTFGCKVIVDEYSPLSTTTGIFGCLKTSGFDRWGLVEVNGYLHIVNFDSDIIPTGYLLPKNTPIDISVKYLIQTNELIVSVKIDSSSTVVYQATQLAILHNVSSVNLLIGIYDMGNSGTLFNGKIWDCYVKQDGDLILYYPLGEPIIDASRHIYHEVIGFKGTNNTPKHAILKQGTKSNQGQQNVTHYLQRGFNKFVDNCFQGNGQAYIDCGFNVPNPSLCKESYRYGFEFYSNHGYMGCTRADNTLDRWGGGSIPSSENGKITVTDFNLSNSGSEGGHYSTNIIPASNQYHKLEFYYNRSEQNYYMILDGVTTLLKSNINIKVATDLKKFFIGAYGLRTGLGVGNIMSTGAKIFNCFLEIDGKIEGDWRLSESITDPANHIYYDRSGNNNHGVLVNGSFDNQGTIDQSAINYPSTLPVKNALIPISLNSALDNNINNHVDVNGTPIKYKQDGKSFLDSGTQLRPYNYPALRNADTDKIWDRDVAFGRFKVQNPIQSKEYFGKGSWDAENFKNAGPDGIGDDIVSISGITNITTYLNNLTPVQDIRERKIRNIFITGESRWLLKDGYWDNTGIWENTAFFIIK